MDWSDKSVERGVKSPSGMAFGFHGVNMELRAKSLELRAKSLEELKTGSTGIVVRSVMYVVCIFQ